MTITQKELQKWIGDTADEKFGKSSQTKSPGLHRQWQAEKIQYVSGAASLTPIVVLLTKALGKISKNINGNNDIISSETIADMALAKARDLLGAQ